MSADTTPNSRPNSAILPLALDGVALMAALAANFWIWLGFVRLGHIPGDYVLLFAHLALPWLTLRLLVYGAGGLYRRTIVRGSRHELATILIANTIIVCIVAGLNAATRFVPSLGPYYPLASGGDHILRLPWGIVAVDWMMGVLVTGGVRFFERELKDYALLAGGPAAKRALIVGTGPTAEHVAKNLVTTTRGAFRPIGFVENGAASGATRLYGLPLLGTLENFAKITESSRPDEIIIAVENPTPRLIRSIVEGGRGTRLRYKIVPDLASLMSGAAHVDPIRPVEIEDLLGRAPVRLGEGDAKSGLRGKSVLVTGGAGSIGSELARQVIREGASNLVLLDHSENGLFETEIELRSEPRADEVRLRTYVGDAGDPELVRGILREHAIQTVFHAAAHKHVHLMESQPCQAALNNVEATRVLAREAGRAGVERFIFVSSDKAVRPAGIMGATKRLSEKVIAEAGRNAEGVFASVRFGNVLGSRGSLLPILKRQIARGGPVTVTHRDATRYFMTAPEAASLIIRAGALAKPGRIYLLDMGEPVKIDAFARDLIRLSGFEPDIDIPIVYTGLRAGEKLREELYIEGSGVEALEDGKIFVWEDPEAGCDPEFTTKLDALARAARNRNEADVRERLRELVPEYQVAANA